jgi:hypothetical protein
MVEEKGAEAWKPTFEANYADDFDRALITSAVCRNFYSDLEDCKQIVEWDHKYDTRDPTLKSEFHAEVETAIAEVVQNRKDEIARKSEL